MKHSFIFRLLATSCAVLGATSAVAAPLLPNTARPDTVERSNMIEDQRPAVGGAPLVTDETVKAKHTGSTATFELKGIKLEGATVYGQEQLSSIWASKLNTKITLDDLNQIAADITAYYRNHGYILTRAIVPPQKDSDGIFTLRIVEGFVNDVRLTGDVGKGNDDLLNAYADKIRAAKPLNSDTLERYLLLMEDLPGVDARAVLAPDDKVQGATDVIITITRHTVQAAASIDNRAGRYLGNEEATASLFLNNLLGRDDQTQFRISNSIFDPSDMLFGEVRHTEPVGTEGTTITFAANKVRTEPGSNLKDLDIVGDSSAFSLSATHPFIRSRRSNWYVNSDFTFRNVEVDTLDQSLYKDKTRVLTVGTSYDFVDGWSGINKMETNIGHGFNWDTGEGLDARSRANGNTDFTKMTGKVTRIQPIYGPFSLFASASGQYAYQALLASEEFTVGGSEYGSAYDPAEISGDSGVAARAELQYNQSVDSQYLQQYQLYTFYDIGKVWNRDAIVGLENSHDSLSSAGVGARVNLLQSTTASVEGAVPMTRDVAARDGAGDDARIFFNLQYRY